MVADAPRGHTSFYLSEYLRDNWGTFRKYIVAKGFSSLNQYINSTVVHDFNTNYADIMNFKAKKSDKIFNIYQELPTNARHIMSTWTDGEMMDLLNLVTSWRNLFIKEMKRREVSI